MQSLRSSPGRLLIAAMLIASAQAGSQSSGSESTPGMDAAQDTCGSVVLVQCAEEAQREAEASRSPPADSLQATRQKLDARRLRQMQEQAGLNTIEVTSERPTGVPSDPWEGFSQSVAGAAVPNCFSPTALPQQPIQVQGLLALPLLLRGAAVGKCR